MNEETGSHSHINDPQAHVEAVAADLTYFRAKRLEPRVLHFARRGIVTLNDLLHAHATAEPADETGPPPAGTEQRIRALEDRLDAFVTEFFATSVPMESADLVVDDLRKERGDYDEFFRVAKRQHVGSLDEQMTQLNDELRDCEELLRTFRAALLASGQVTEQQLEQRHALITAQGHRNGARIVARAWTDDDFKRRLLETGREVVRELGIPPGKLGKLGVAENTEEEHNVVVCTLCSCYPTDLLGNPPWWYRTDEYRSRMVEEPRTMLKEMFDLEVPRGRTIVVRDSTSDIRWMVLPRRPEGTEGMTEEELAELVSPESLVGVAEPANLSGRRG